MEAADLLDCYAVVNNGWKRADKVDAILDWLIATTSNHCLEPVVKEEFLDPIETSIAIL